MSQFVEPIPAFDVECVAGSRYFLQTGSGDVLSQEIGILSRNQDVTTPGDDERRCLDRAQPWGAVEARYG